MALGRLPCRERHPTPSPKELGLHVGPLVDHFAPLMPHTYIVTGRAASSGISRSPRARPQNHQNLRRCSFCFSIGPNKTGGPTACYLRFVLVRVWVWVVKFTTTGFHWQGNTRFGPSPAHWMYAGSDKSLAISVLMIPSPVVERFTTQSVQTGIFDSVIHSTKYWCTLNLVVAKKENSNNDKKVQIIISVNLF